MAFRDPLFEQPACAEVKNRRGVTGAARLRMCPIRSASSPSTNVPRPTIFPFRSGQSPKATSSWRRSKPIFLWLCLKVQMRFLP